jgi:regulatory protein
MPVERKYPPVRTLSEIKRWCDRQERAHSEVLHKLYQWGVPGEEARQLLAELITGNYLNEERFARAFARGKYRIKGWGWKKVEAGLKARGVSPACIAAAHSEYLSENDGSTLHRVVAQKWEQLKSKGLNTYEAKARVFRFALAKGYQIGEIQDALAMMKD